MAVIKTETFHEAWDCDVCGTEGLSAYNCKQCPSCGAPLDEEGVYRTRKVVANYEFKGHDVQCAHCRTRNEKRFSCRNCGASLTDGDDERVESFTYKSDTDGRPPKQRARTRHTAVPRDLRPGTLSRESRPKRSNRTWWYLGGFVAVVAAAVGMWVFSQMHAVIPATLTADRAHWAFYLALEDYAPRQETMTVEDGGFGSPPDDAYNVDSSRVHIRSEPIYETRSVPNTCTGTSSTSNGDGTWTEVTYTYDCSYSERVQVGTDEIYGTRYDYLVNRWEAIAPLTKDGWGQETHFPTFTTPERCLSTRPTFGCKRAPNEPHLTFTIHFFYYTEDAEERQEVSRTMEQDIWDDISLGENYDAVLNGFGEIRAIRGIDPAYEELMANES